MSRQQQPGRVFRVTEQGAIADDELADTAAIQAAMDKCESSGGGEVMLTGGRFIAGQLNLRGGVTLVVAADAVLQASPEPADYPDRVWLRADRLKRVGLRGPGKLAGGGSACFDIHLADVMQWKQAGAQTGAVKHPVRRLGVPVSHLIQFAECEDVRVSRVLIEDSPTWTLHLLGCERVRIEDVTINNLCYGSYNDGMDIDGSSHVLVKNCVVTAGDDAFCIKTSGHRGIRRASSDIVFEDCLARSPTNGFKIGTETLDDIRDVVIRRCRVEGPLPFVVPLAGIAIASVDGAEIENVTLDDVRMGPVRCPIFIRLGARWKNVQPDQRCAGSIVGVSLSKVEVARSQQCITLAGLPAQPLRHIQLREVHVRRFDGSTSPRPPSDIPEHPAAYPESPMFGKLPARLLFARHVTGLQTHDVSLEASQATDAQAIIHVDVIENPLAVARP